MPRPHGAPADLIVFPPLHDDVEMHDAFMQVLTTHNGRISVAGHRAGHSGHKVAVG